MTPLVLLCLACTYFIWGSSFLAIRITLESMPPLTTAGLRFLFAGLLLLLLARARRCTMPSTRDWPRAVCIGALLMLGGNGLLMVSQQWVDSGLAAVVVASVGLWAPLVAGVLGEWPTRREWLAAGLGLLGVGVLNLEGNLAAHPLGAALLLVSSLSWATGSVLSRRLALRPDGPAGMTLPAMEMTAGGLLLLLAGQAIGERFAGWPSSRSLAAFAFLLTLGCLLGFTAYRYLLQTVSAALATSYVFVNPVVALALGVALGGERISPRGVGATLMVVLSVALVLSAGREPGGPEPAGEPG